jgi:diguanylate cyclase (GGDEF)-like protein
MAEDRNSPTIDAFEDDLRLRSVTVGVLLTGVAALVVAAYCGFTWDQPHRPLLIAIVAAAVLVGVAVSLLPLENVIRSRWREPFFLTWSCAMIAVVGALVVLDGTDESPLALVFVLPLIFAASSYPLRSTLIVSVADVGAWFAVGVSDGDDNVARAVVVTGLLGAAAMMCVLQARNHEQQREALELISRTDPLTGVLNRRGFEERLAAALRTAERSGQPVALLLLDLDSFKPVNDREGHAAGDALLQWVVERIAHCVRPADVVGRIGGDEFGVVAPDVDAREAAELSARIVRALEPRIGVSIGTADYPSDGTTADDLHRRADEALYRVKRSRRGDVPPHIAPIVRRGGVLPSCARAAT